MAGAQAFEVAAADAAAGLGELGGREHLAHAGAAAPSTSTGVGAAEAVDDLGLASVEQRRQHAVGDDRGRRRPRSRRRGGRAGRSSRSTGISSGVVTITTPGHASGPRGCRASTRVWSRTMPDLHEIADHPRRTDLGDDVAASPRRRRRPGRSGARAPRRRACRRRGSPSRRARRRRRSRTCGRAARCARRSGTLTNSRRYSRSESSVFIAMPNRFGARPGAARTRAALASNAAASAPLASISQTSVRWPLRAARSASAAAIDVLPTPPLPVTKSSWRSSSGRRSPAARADRRRRRSDQPPKPMRRSPSACRARRRRSSPPARRSAARGCRSATARRLAPASAASTAASVASFSASSISTLISRGAWVTPMRTSTAGSVRCESAEDTRVGSCDTARRAFDLRVPPLPPPGWRAARVLCCRRRVAGARRRRPRLAPHRRRHAGQPAPLLAGRRARRLDLHA